VLLDRQGRFQPVTMTEEMALLGQRPLRSASFQGDCSPCRRKQAGDQPKQRGLACAIATADGKRFATADREVERRKDLAPTPTAPHLAARKPHRSLKANAGLLSCLPRKRLRKQFEMHPRKAIC